MKGDFHAPFCGSPGVRFPPGRPAREDRRLVVIQTGEMRVLYNCDLLRSSCRLASTVIVCASPTWIYFTGCSMTITRELDIVPRSPVDKPSLCIAGNVCRDAPWNASRSPHTSSVQRRDFRGWR